MLQYQRHRRTVQTVKLTLYHRATASPLERRIIDPNPKRSAALRARYPDVRSSKQTKPPAYLFRYYQCQRATQRQKPDQCALISTARPPCIPLNYPPSVPTRPQPVAPSSVPTSASAPPVKGYLESPSLLRKQKFHQSRKKPNFLLGLGI